MRRSSEIVQDSFSLTDIGRVRSHNEDSAGIVSGPGFTLLAVFDGMGGHKRGEIASSIALDCFKRAFQDLKKAPSMTAGKRLIRETLKEANSKILIQATGEPSCRGMGTTAVVALVLQDQTIIASMGDSRCYILKPNRVNIVQVTTDDSFVEMLLAKGKISKAQARVHPDRNIITNALGINEKMHCRISVIPNDYKDILLCSDGLYNMVTDASISRILKREDPVKGRVVALINTANYQGGRDNISAVLLERRKV